MMRVCFRRLVSFILKNRSLGRRVPAPTWSTPEPQGETTNLQTAEGVILTPKDGKTDARSIMRKRKKVMYLKFSVNFSCL